MGNVAALLLQGSVQVYSRKVEYLYSLVLRALEFLSRKRFANLFFLVKILFGSFRFLYDYVMDLSLSGNYGLRVIGVIE